MGQSSIFTRAMLRHSEHKMRAPSNKEMRMIWSIDWTRRSDTLCWWSIIMIYYPLSQFVHHTLTDQQPWLNSLYININQTPPNKPNILKNNLIDIFGAQLDDDDDAITNRSQVNVIRFWQRMVYDWSVYVFFCSHFLYKGNELFICVMCSICAGFWLIDQ